MYHGTDLIVRRLPPLAGSGPPPITENTQPVLREISVKKLPSMSGSSRIALQENQCQRQFNTLQ